MRVRSLESMAAIVLVVITCAVASAEDNNSKDWNQWRGPNRDGQIAKTEWPGSLEKGSLDQSWKVKLGPSYSGPIIAGDWVFTTETKDKKSEVVRAFDRKTGKQVWEKDWAGAMKVPFFAAANGSWIRSTPVYSDGKLYVAGIKDVIVCLDAMTGNVDWKLDFVKRTGSKVPSFGCASSPMVHGKFLYMQGGGAVYKIDKKSGKIVWSSSKNQAGMMSDGAFSSPIVATLGGVEQVVVQTREKLVGINIETGSELWGKPIPSFRGMNILTPTIIGDTIFTSNYRGKSYLYEVKKSGGKFSITEKWNNRLSAYMSSGVVIEGHMYLHLQNQRFACIDLKDGAIKWRSSPFGKYWSIIANGNQMLALDQTGDLLLINANPEKFEVVSKRKVANDSWAHLGIVGDQVFVRDLNGLYVYLWK